MRARLQLFGTPSVVDAAGRRHDLVLERPVALLVLLALRGTWVGRAELAALFRPDAVDEEAQAYLRKLVFRARRQPWAADLEAEAGRLRWRVASDVRAFRDAVARGDDAAAMAAYAGPLLDGVDLPAVASVRAWLEAERDDLTVAWRAVVLRHAAAREAAGDGTAAAGMLERLRAADPLDEEAVQALLRVQVSLGRASAAWATFEAFRGALEAELGIEPLEGTLALAALARPTPSAASTLDGARIAVDAAPSTARVLGAPPGEGPFVGRAEELARVARWWAGGDGRWVTLAGLGGAGKTRLALELARAWSARHGADAAFVACSGRGRLDEVAIAIAEAWGWDVGGRVVPRDAVAARLRERATLLVLDDLEPGVAVDVAAWLDPLTSVLAVATARAPFEFPGEWLVDVGGLPVPPEGAHLDAAGFDAVRLFTTLAERRAAIPIVGGDGLDAVARLCRRVGGLPLALVLAAAWTRAASVEALLARMDEDVAALQGGDADVAPRHRDLVAVIDATLELLDAADRAALRSLAAFGAAFTAAAAERVAGAGLARLLRFVNLGLVGRAPDGNYRVHPFVREVVDRRASVEERAHARAAVRLHAAAVLSEAVVDLTRRDETAGLRRLAPEFDVLRSAWREAIADGDGASLAAMETGLYLAWDARAAYHEGFEAFASAAASTDDPATARRLDLRTGYFALRLGRAEEAAERLRVAADGPPSEAAFAIHNLGVLDLIAGRHEAARARFVDAHERYAAMQDAWGTSRAAHNLSVLAQFAGDLTTSEAWGRRALAQCRALGNQRGVAGAANNLGSVLEERGAWDEAEAAYREALDLYAAARDPRGAAAAWTNLGHVAERRGDDAAAAIAYERGLELKRALGDPAAIVVSLANLADVCVRRGEAERARAMIREALRLATAADADTYVARALWTHARERAHAGDRAEAARIAEALATFGAAEAWVRAAAIEARAAWRAGEDDPSGDGPAGDGVDGGQDGGQDVGQDVGPDAGIAGVRAAVARALGADAAPEALG